MNNTDKDVHALREALRATPTGLTDTQVHRLFQNNRSTWQLARIKHHLIKRKLAIAVQEGKKTKLIATKPYGVQHDQSVRWK